MRPGRSADSTHRGTPRRGWPARPRHGPPPEAPPRKSSAQPAGRCWPGVQATPLSRTHLTRPRPFRRQPRPFRSSGAGCGARLVVMARGAATAARRRVRGAPPVRARGRSAEDWWWDRLAPSGSGYHLLQADSMLLVLPGPGPARARTHRRAARRAHRLRPPGTCAVAAKAKPRPAPAPEAPQGPDPGWGDRIPLEILLQIFGLLVATDGPMPFLGRAARVCRRWHEAASQPALWHTVTLSPPLAGRPALGEAKAEKKLLASLEWLMPTRFSQLQRLTLIHWKSQVLRLLNLMWLPKPSGRVVTPGPGFPGLEELCLASSTCNFVSNEVLGRLLHGSPNLRLLDLRGCARITPAGLRDLPCQELEQLHLGLYGMSDRLTLVKEGSALLTQKWCHTLRELDLSGQGFSEKDLDHALAAFSGIPGGSRPALCSLNLRGTRVTPSTVSSVISSCPGLLYLNLESCRCLPRGLKRAYRGPEEVQWCLEQLLTSLPSLS
uniref:F-box and leucine rich repeat protein 6 n=1 Tax=Equus asinus TaxID=9793 RepID=A0A8C4PLW5_EQUAS